MLSIFLLRRGKNKYLEEQKSAGKNKFSEGVGGMGEILARKYISLQGYLGVSVTVVFRHAAHS